MRKESKGGKKRERKTLESTILPAAGLPLYSQAMAQSLLLVTQLSLCRPLVSLEFSILHKVGVKWGGSLQEVQMEVSRSQLGVTGFPEGHNPGGHTMSFPVPFVYFTE